MSKQLIDSIGFGCVSLTSHAFQANVMQLLTTALESGIKHFDTAPAYGSGYSEALLGSFLKQIQDDSQAITVTTKFGLYSPVKLVLPTRVALLANQLKRLLIKRANPRPLQPVQTRLAVDKLTAQKPTITQRHLEESLRSSQKRLKRARIDYFMIHEALPRVITDEALEWLIKMRDSGQIGRLGVASNYKMILMAEQSELENWDVLQYEFTPESYDLIHAQFPHKTHIVHSCIKLLGSQFSLDYGFETAGDILKHLSQDIRLKHILFSTRSACRLKENISSLL